MNIQDMTQNNHPIKPQPLYKIGAVSNITGLTSHSIRAWERQYGLKIAQRSDGGTRLYSDQDIIILSLIRDLIKQGDAIGEIAGLSEEEMRERLKSYDPIATSRTNEKPCKVKKSVNEIEINQSSASSTRLFSDAQLMKLSQISTDIDSDYLKTIAFILFEINSLENRFNHLSSISEKDQAFHLNLYQKTAIVRGLLESMLTAACSHEKLEGLYYY